MSDFHIEEAYCIELGRNVTIWEANDYYFSLSASQRRRLHFECPDEKCREEAHPKVTGVNYDKKNFIRPMHFRRNSDYQHREGCSLGMYEKVLQEMLRNKGLYRKNSGRNLFLDLPDSDRIPDVFQPWREVEVKRNQPAGAPRQGAGATVRNRGAIEDKIRRAQYKTRSMQTVVEAFEKLSTDQRNIPSLTIEGQTLKYSTVFKHIKYMEEWHTWPHIYYGSARIFRYHDGFRAFFGGRVRKFLPDKPNLEASIFFPLDNEKVPEDHPYDALKHAAQTREHCCVYMFASKTLMNAPLGSSDDSKEWIRLETAPGETVITFNDRLCI